MTEKKAELSEAMKEKLTPRKFVKIQFGTKHTLLFLAQKEEGFLFAVNIAFALQNIGLKIGILDADVYGPSLPKLIGINEKPQSEDGKILVPIEKFKAQCIHIFSR